MPAKKPNVRARVKVQGIPRLRRAFKTFDDASKEEIRVAIRTTTEAVAAGWRARVPVRSGVGRGDIRTRYAKSGLSGRATHSKKSYYLYFVERGTRKIRAKPALFPAAEQQRQPHVVRLTAAVKRAESRAAGG